MSFAFSRPTSIMQQTNNLTQPEINDEYGHIYQTKADRTKSFGIKLYYGMTKVFHLADQPLSYNKHITSHNLS